MKDPIETLAKEIEDIVLEMNGHADHASAAVTARALGDKWITMIRAGRPAQSLHDDVDNLIDGLEVFRSSVIAAAAKHGLITR